MNARSYKLIFILMGCCVLFIIILQGFWIRNFYLKETEAFSRQVYSTLEKAATKLQERKNLQALKMTYIIVDGDTIAKTPSRHMKLSTEANTRLINRNSVSVNTKTIAIVKSLRHKIINDSVVINGDSQHANIIMKGEKGKKPKILVYKNNKQQAQQPPEEKENITKLIDKMITEIKVLDTETENPDTLKAIIKRILDNQGLFLPFEFSLQKNKQVIFQSRGFMQNQPLYRTDLSANKLINTHDFLLLQFPERNNYVLAGMKSSLILSGIFSIIILSVFYSVLRLILHQKKLSGIKNDFINNMTHELKTPIATISLAIDAINNPQVKSDHEKFDQYTAILKEETHKLNNHVERVLQMSLIDKGNLQLHKKRVNLAGIINSAIDAHKLQVEHCNGRILFEEAQTPAFIMGDEFHLLATFNNLLDNALKYSSENCLVQISLHKTVTDLIVTIKDNGIGIDTDHHKKIFDKFYRVQGGNLHDVKGFGLGLSYVKSIVESHTGSVELQSEKGKGSTFIIKLPVNEA